MNVVTSVAFCVLIVAFIVMVSSHNNKDPHVPA